MKNKKICPKCKLVYQDKPDIKYCICGYKFESSLFEMLKKVSGDPFGFDIREGLNKK